MTCSEILHGSDQGIATITLNRPDRLNAWTPAMASELRQALERATAEPEVWVIVLTGAGRGFCALDRARASSASWR
jgi:enoyl-CoA hydratase/carnithine racemase